MLSKYEYSVHYGKFFHSRNEIFKRFEEDAQELAKQISEQGGRCNFCNCWAARTVFGVEECPSESNYEKFADKMDD